MIFRVNKRNYEELGTEKAFIDHDGFNHYYYIPRSQVKILDTEEYDNGYLRYTDLIVDIANWIFRKNNIPAFNLTELRLATDYKVDKES